MKTRIIKTIITLMLMFMALPMMSQDYLIIHFKNGDFRKFYLKNVTEITTSKFDADGVQHGDYDYQHITTIYDKYVYSLENVESITFTKIDEELAEHNFVTAMPIVFNTISDCETIDDVEDRIDIIKNAEGVEDAWSDGHILSIKIAEGEIYTFHFNHDASIDNDTYEDASSQIKAMLPRLASVVKQKDTQLKAVIANQQHKDEDRKWHKTSFFDPLKEAFEACGIHTDYIEEPTIDFFYDHCKNPKPDDHLNLYDYDIIFLITHGSYGAKLFWNDKTNKAEWMDFSCHSFLTSEDILKVKGDHYWDVYYQTFRDWRDESSYKDVTDFQINYGFCEEKRFNKETKRNEWVWVAHPSLLETFFCQIVPIETKFSNPNSIFFNIACQSMKGDGNDAAMSMANHFTQDRGLGVYYGYTESNYRGQGAGYEFFKSMIQGKSISKSYSDLDNLYKLESDMDEHAGLMRWPAGENGDLFLFPTYTEPIDQETVMNNYNTINAVEVIGWATSLDPTIINGGFEYGTDDTFSSCKKASNAEFLPLSQSTQKGNVRFRAKLTELEPEKTYYYRAYTYDGMNYNYGEQYSFKIEAQPADEKVVMLSQNVGDTTYEIYKINTDKEDYHINPDGWKCYKSSLMLDMTKNGKTSTYTLDDNIYLDNSDNHHGGQRPCLYLSSSTDQLFVFINSKDSRNSYSMDGYAYRTSLSNVSFTKETVFTGRNWGWYPYFTYSDGVLSVQHFSFAGYYAMTSYRNSDGTWTTQQGNNIKPDAFNEQSEQAGNVLVDDNAYPYPDVSPAEAIDLGLPSGTKWASCNVGATKPEEYGGYYAWGETEEKSYYDWSTYIHCDGSYSTCHDLGPDISGTEYDVAHVKWGGNWRMPTTDEQRELLDNCTTEWMTLNGVNGRKFTSNINGNSIFLPAAGYLLYDSFGATSGVGGDYWSSKPSSMRKNSYNLRFDSTDISFGTYDRRDGKPVRPVYK